MRNTETDFRWNKERVAGTKNIAKSAAVFVMLTILVLAGCRKEEMLISNTSPSASQKGNKMLTGARAIGDYMQVNLVADASSLNPMRTDANLNNAWGIAFGERGEIWIASNHKGLSVIYDRNGNQVRTPVDIPLNGAPAGASPDGVVYNDSKGFNIPSSGGMVMRSEFLFATEDGIISAWVSGSMAVTVVDRSRMGTVYKGLAMAENGSTPLLYAADFSNGKVDVFDENFKLIPITLRDPGMPMGFAPFNVAAIDGKLFVTYAMQKPDHHDDQAGPGNGYISIFNPDGSFVQRFASQGALNSPWGIAETEGAPGTEKILVGNFGDGHISIFDIKGNYEGQLMSHGKPIIIEGLWAIALARGTNGFDEAPMRFTEGTRLYFTAGPNEENHGLFGYLQRR